MVFFKVVVRTGVFIIMAFFLRAVFVMFCDNGGDIMVVVI